MTLEELKENVRKLQAEIASGERDVEGWHIWEDSLYKAVLEHYRDQGCPLATEVLKIDEMDHVRWYA